jgi:AhpD family alkylhydroperoxidase
MKPRIEYAKAAPGTVQAMRALETYVQQSGLERSLLHLIKTRASQINGCAFCLDMHTREAREDGETEERLYVLSAWRETADYTERERAALAWTEAVTRIADGHVPDDVYEVARQQFTDKELADLTLAVVAINGWNRLSIAFRTLPARSREARREETPVTSRDGSRQAAGEA